MASAGQMTLFNANNIHVVVYVLYLIGVGLFYIKKNPEWVSANLFRGFPLILTIFFFFCPSPLLKSMVLYIYISIYFSLYL